MPLEVEQIGDCTLYRGDAMDVFPTLEQVEAIVTDPPYGVGLGRDNNTHRTTRYGAHLGKQGYVSYEDSYENFIHLIVPRLTTALNLGRCAAAFSGPHIHEQRKPNAIGGIYLAQACGRTTWGSKNFLPVLFYGVPPSPGQHRSTVIIDNSRAEPSDHPCPKPLSWMTWLVQLGSRARDTILDPFAGSFTTGVACLQMDRRFIGIEIESRYFDLGCRRIETAYKQLELFPSRPVHTQPQQLTMIGAR
jgi:site-specific DNA-methyltransferase (adenine-specific)